MTMSPEMKLAIEENTRKQADSTLACTAQCSYDQFKIWWHSTWERDHKLTCFHEINYGITEEI